MTDKEQIIIDGCNVSECVHYEDYTREQKVIELCTQKFNTTQEIQQCKAVLMEIER